MIQPSEGLIVKFKDGNTVTVYRYTDNAVYCKKDGVTHTIISMFEWKMNFKDPSKIKIPFEIVQEKSEDN